MRFSVNESGTRSWLVSQGCLSPTRKETRLFRVAKSCEVGRVAFYIDQVIRARVNVATKRCCHVRLLTWANIPSGGSGRQHVAKRAFYGVAKLIGFALAQGEQVVASVWAALLVQGDRPRYLRRVDREILRLDDIAWKWRSALGLVHVVDSCGTKMAHESRCARCQVDSLITVIVDGIAALFRRDARVEKAALCKADRAAKGVAGGIASAWTGPLTLLNGLHLAIAAVFKLAGGTTAIAVLSVGIVAPRPGIRPPRRHCPRRFRLQALVRSQPSTELPRAE